MSTDRELLELAAKAAGIALHWKAGACKGGSFTAPFVLQGDELVPWRPLTDDGDALRLAVKLGLEISVAFAQAYACQFGTLQGRELHVPFGDVHGPGTLDRKSARYSARAVSRSSGSR
jgi:hypothetical protein